MVKSYREITVSSTILVVIILAIIGLGAVIFFLGVQVGKKEADLMMKNLIAQKIEEEVKATPPVPVVEEKATSSAEATQTAESASGTVSHPSGTSAEEKKIQMVDRSIYPKPSAESGAPVISAPARTSQATTTTPPVTSSPPKPSEATRTSGNYYIQVGAFNDRPTARLEAEKYRKQGYNAVVKDPFESDKRPLYRVWVGGYRTREEAQKALADLVKKMPRNPGFFIVHE